MTERWKPLHAASAKELDILVRSLTDRAEKAEAEVAALRARVQAVRDVCKTYHLDDSYPNRRKVVFLDRILRALDGDA